MVHGCSLVHQLPLDFFTKDVVVDLIKVFLLKRNDSFDCLDFLQFLQEKENEPSSEGARSQAVSKVNQAINIWLNFMLVGQTLTQAKVMEWYCLKSKDPRPPGID